MQWQDFAQYLAEHGEDFRNNLDDHFYPIWGYCDPCSLPFNFFVKLDTFTEGKVLKNKYLEFSCTASILMIQTGDAAPLATYYLETRAYARGGGGGGLGFKPPLPIDLWTKIHNKENITFLARLSLLF